MFVVFHCSDFYSRKFVLCNQTDFIKFSSATYYGVSYLTSLGLSFFIIKMKLLIFTMNIFQGENEMAWNHLGYGASIQKKKKKSQWSLCSFSSCTMAQDHYYSIGPFSQGFIWKEDKNTHWKIMGKSDGLQSSVKSDGILKWAHYGKWPFSI